MLGSGVEANQWRNNMMGEKKSSLLSFTHLANFLPNLEVLIGIISFELGLILSNGCLKGANSMKVM